MPTYIWICISVASAIFAYLVGNNSLLPRGWYWTISLDNQTLCLCNANDIIVATIFKIDHIYWILDDKKYTSTWRAQRAVVRQVLGK